MLGLELSSLSFRTPRCRFEQRSTDAAMFSARRVCFIWHQSAADAHVLARRFLLRRECVFLKIANHDRIRPPLVPILRSPDPYAEYCVYHTDVDDGVLLPTDLRSFVSGLLLWDAPVMTCWESGVIRRCW
jgi:hypothetical protein